MAQRGPVPRRARPSLKHIARELVRLVDAIDELEELKAKVKAAEASRVLH